MKSIFYVSNMQSDLFTSNTRSNFQTYIHPNDLNYISSSYDQSDNIEVSVKSITLDNDLKDEDTLVLKTNLTHDTISSFGWDNIVSIFNVNPKTKGSILQIKFVNPTFFPTTREKLSKANFKIVSLKTGEFPQFSIGSPTFIEVAIRRQTRRMKAPFHILLDSSCEESKKRFPTNTNMNFCIQLPQRMEFRRDWSVCLKSIHFSNKFLTLGDCTLTIHGLKVDGGNKWKTQIGLGKNFPYNVGELLSLLNKQSKGFLNFELLKSDHLQINVDRRYPTEHYGSTFNVQFSDDLKNILGFDRNEFTISRDQPSGIIAPYKLNIFALNPRHFIVCCDLVEESLLGGQRVQVLKYFPKKISQDSTVDVEFINNDYVKLNLKNFDRIRIRIADITGKTVMCSPDIPTRMQLLFVNVNSQT